MKSCIYVYFTDKLINLKTKYCSICSLSPNSFYDIIGFGCFYFESCLYINSLINVFGLRRHQPFVGGFNLCP